MDMVSERTESQKWKKAGLAAIAGAVAGFAASMAFLLGTDEFGGVLSESAKIAGIVAIIYILTSLMVGVGLVSPGFGVRFLNVEDRSELREQRTLLAYSAASILALGSGLLLVVLSGPGGTFGPDIGLIAVPLVAIGLVLGIRQWRYADELMRTVSHESAATAFYLLFAIGGGWAILAHLEYLAPPATLDWLSMIWAAGLFGSFIASARRGLLAPR
ncbi:hypothetical protein [Aurantiacibacter hainanensis]|uniref:hypothetical protein n=1 Tax=Aurantiacibacter hainanensis TaxID=3076114 RepID=UPI0030C759BE